MLPTSPFRGSDRTIPELRPPRVAEEIRQQRPFRSRGQEAAVSLLRTADEVRRHFSEALEAEAVTLQQFNVLRILRGAGEGGVPTLEIGARMIERQPGITRLIDRLVTKGLVRRERGVEDRRQVICHITPEGLRLLGELDAAVDRADARLADALAEGERERLIELLDRLRRAIVVSREG